jgi:hypothetical protein
MASSAARGLFWLGLAIALVFLSMIQLTPGIVP